MGICKRPNLLEDTQDLPAVFSPKEGYRGTLIPRGKIVIHADLSSKEAALK